MPQSSSDSVLENRTEDIALRLFFKNPYVKNILNEHSEIEQIISKKDLLGTGNIELDSILLGNVIVKIKYHEGLLSIKTTDEVDVFLSGGIPAKAVHIETNGCCALIDGEAKGLSLGLFIKANGIVLDMPIKNAGFIALLPAYKYDNTVQIKQPVDVKLLRIDAMDLLLGAKVQAGKTIVKCKLLHNFADGELVVTGRQKSSPNQNDTLTPFSSKQSLDWNEAVDKHSFIEEHDHIRGKIYRLTESLLITQDLINDGSLNLTKTIIKSFNSVQVLPNSNVKLNNVKVFSKGMLISTLTNIIGSNTSLKLSDNLDIEGSCIIDGLAVYAHEIIVSGLLWGGDNLFIQIKENASFNGIVGSKHTTIKSKYMLATAVLGNEGLYYKTFVNGGIIGTSTLTIESLTCVRTGGAYLYAPTLFLNNGIDVGIFSYIRTYNRFKNCGYEYCSLENTLICKPESMSDLVNANKLLRVAEMIGSNFPVLRGMVAVLNIGMLIGPGCKSALNTAFASLREDPNLLHQLKNLGSAGKASVIAAAKSAQNNYELFANLAMGEWSTDKLKDFVEILLQANGLRVYANSLISQTTGALIFVNDIQNLAYSKPNITDENAKELASAVLGSIKNLNDDKKYRTKTTFGPLDAAKFISDNLTVLKKDTNAPKNKSEDTITLMQAAKDAARNQVSELINAPKTLVARVLGAVDAIQSINPAETASQLVTSTGKHLDEFMTVGKAVLNAGPTPHPTQVPKINGAFLWDMTKESVRLLGPSAYTTSFVSETGGFTLTGNYIVNTGFYRNNGVVLALGASVHCLYDSSNYGAIFSQRYTETARNRNNRGAVLAAEANISVGNNNEYGVTEASTRMVFDIKNHLVAEGAKFRSVGQTSGHISGTMITHGQQDLRNGHLHHDGTTEFGTTADTTLKNMSLDLKHEFDLNGKMHLEQVHGVIKSKVIFKSTLNAYANNVIFKAKGVYRQDGSVVNLENKLLFEAEHVGSGLNSVLNGSADSLLVIKSETADELGSHNIGNGVFKISYLDPEASYRFAAGLAEYQNKNYSHSIFVSTARTETLTYAPINRTDGAFATLLTGGVVSLPSAYDGRAKGVTFNTHRDAERFVAGYDGYKVPGIVIPKKGLKEKFYESVNEAANVATEAGFSSSSIPGLIVACIAMPVNWITGHKARKLARQRNAAIEAETMRLANIQRDITHRTLALDERSDLAELHNFRNDFRVINFFEATRSSGELAESNHFTQQDMLQYQREITSRYETRRLEAQQQHSSYVNEVAKHFAGQREQILKSGGMNLHFGLSANVGSNGYTVSTTYGGGFGSRMGYGKIPVYDKTYTYLSPNQPVATQPKLDHVSQRSDLPATAHDELEFAVNEGRGTGSVSRNTGASELKNDSKHSNQFKNATKDKTKVTKTSEQTMLGNIGYSDASNDSLPQIRPNTGGVSDQGLAVQAKYGAVYVLNAAYRGVKFVVSPIEMLSAGNALGYRQLTESFEDQVARERGYMEQGKVLSRFLERPVANTKSFAVSYFENSNQAYQEAIAAGNYFQAAIIKSNMHCDIAESTVGLVTGGMGVYKTASKVANVAATQGSKALLWSAQHSSGRTGNPKLSTHAENFSSGGDRLKSTLGPARLFYKEEYNAIMNELKVNGVKISFRDNQYAYGPAKNAPGNLVIDADASISALRHEFGHFMDDKRLGFPGMKFYMENPGLRIASERRQYLNELQTAKAFKDMYARRSLIQDYLEEKEFIVSRFYTSPYGGKSLIKLRLE